MLADIAKLPPMSVTVCATDFPAMTNSMTDTGSIGIRPLILIATVSWEQLGETVCNELFGAQPGLIIVVNRENTVAPTAPV